MEAIRVDIQNAGGSVSDEMVCLLLMKMRPYWPELVVAVELKEQAVSWRQLSKVMHDECDRRRDSPSTDHSIAQVATRPSRKPGGQGKNIKCNNCGKKGHKKASCWAPGGGKEGNAPKWYKRQESNSGNKVGASQAGVSNVRSGEEELSPRYMWVIDSGATNHFTPHKDLLENYTDFNSPIKVTTAASQEVLAKGQGTVTVRFPAGAHKKVLFAIRNVHWGNIGCNLWSIPELDRKGLKANW
eukprot:Plantae.Rhodophyta-Rhodochaete_pulchella.ctg39248.p1 GENE.Plantae.Rhodophyta-Rhodochaete_pulchella.ctg39248~~Plantae.Rhodophyta-Rhodochaete_pulchella.ctg39248.p1  ORF type:complete len:242 (+),score=26.49 Plantae.Rhodophyta-Rhodochaete_pulchella.ctg39248:918-1643(+)